VTARPAPAVAGPLVAGERWREVIERAGARCECRAECGRQHRDGQGRCTRENAPRAPLHAVAREPVPFPAAATLPATALRALCDPCHAALASSHTRARQAAHDALSAVETLF
jgi:hypothetical protein